MYLDRETVLQRPINRDHMNLSVFLEVALSRQPIQTFAAKFLITQFSLTPIREFWTRQGGAGINEKPVNKN